MMNPPVEYVTLAHLQNLRALRSVCGECREGRVLREVDPYHDMRLQVGIQPTVDNDNYYNCHCQVQHKYSILTLLHVAWNPMNLIKEAAAAGKDM